MMQWLVILVIGVIQGITEFMPVSSSAHLLVAGNLLELADNFEIYVLVNIGTLGALIWFSRKILLKILRQTFSGSYQLLAKVVVSTLPAGLLGFFLADIFRELSENLYLLVAMLIVVGVLMLFNPPPTRTKKIDLEDISWRQVLAIAFAQPLALIVGTSRAGITILAGIWAGLKRELAVTWSFLIAIPLVTGAVLRVVFSATGAAFISREFVLVVSINLVSFLVGIFAISFLIRILQKHSLRPFGIYRIGLGLVLLGLLLTNVL